MDLLAFLGGELRPEDQRPVVEPFADNRRTELVGGGLQRRDVVDSKKGIVGLAEADLVGRGAIASTDPPSSMRITIAAE